MDGYDFCAGHIVVHPSDLWSFMMHVTRFAIQGLLDWILDYASCLYATLANFFAPTPHPPSSRDCHSADVKLSLVNI